MIRLFDLGYGVAISIGRWERRFHLPFPLSLHSWCYLISHHWRNFKCRIDWHDYPDDADFPHPAHFYTYTCRFCHHDFEI